MVKTENDFRIYFVYLSQGLRPCFLEKCAIEVYLNSSGFISHYAFKACYIHKNREKSDYI